MMKLKAICAAVALTLAGIQAEATYFPPGWNTTDKVTIDKDQSGYNFVVDFLGKAANSATSNLSALGNFTFTGVDPLNSKKWNFTYSITNDSNFDSKIRSFGFDTSVSDPSTFTGNSPFTYEYANASFIEGVGTMDVCFAGGSDGCTGHNTGSGTSYINDGQTGNGSFSLTFANVMEEVTFDHFAMKFVSVSPNVNGQNWGAGLGQIVSITPPNNQPLVAPEPGTWLMMLGGFGMIGYAMRRRERPGRALQLA